MSVWRAVSYVCKMVFHCALDIHTFAYRFLSSKLEKGCNILGIID